MAVVRIRQVPSSNDNKVAKPKDVEKLTEIARAVRKNAIREAIARKIQLRSRRRDN